LLKDTDKQVTSCEPLEKGMNPAAFFAKDRVAIIIYLTGHSRRLGFQAVK
jgi:hypothetical protein